MSAPIAIPPSARYSWMPDLLTFPREHCKPWEYLSPSSLAAQESAVAEGRSPAPGGFHLLARAPPGAVLSV